MSAWNSSGILRGSAVCFDGMGGWVYFVRLFFWHPVSINRGRRCTPLKSTPWPPRFAGLLEVFSPPGGARPGAVPFNRVRLIPGLPHAFAHGSDHGRLVQSAPSELLSPGGVGPGGHLDRGQLLLRGTQADRPTPRRGSLRHQRPSHRHPGFLPPGRTAAGKNGRGCALVTAGIFLAVVHGHARGQATASSRSGAS